MANTVKLTFAGDTDNLGRAYNRVGAAAKSTSDTVDAHSKRIGGSFKSMGVAAAAGVAALTTAVVSFAKDSVTAFVEAQESQQRLEDAFTRFPALANTNLAALQALNQELARKTKFDDDAFASGQAILAQFKLTGTQVAALTPLLADYAAKTGKDLPTAAETLGKAFLGNTRALKELGINYKSTGDQAKDIANITALLRTQVGGFAEQQGKTAAGQAAILSNRFGEVKETVGEKLLPVLLVLGDTLLKVIGFFERHSQIIGPLAIILGTLVAVQWALNIAMAANPIGLIITAIVLLIGVIVFLATKTRFFQTIWEAVWGFLKAVGAWFAGPFAGFFVNTWNAIVDKFNFARKLIAAVIDRLKSDFAKVFGFITAPFRAAFNFVSDAWNNTIGRLRWTVPSWVPIIGGNTISVPKLPHFHTGGVVPGSFGKETLAVLQAGERVTGGSHSDGDPPDVVVIDLGDEIMNLIRRKVGQRGGNVQLVLGNARG